MCCRDTGAALPHGDVLGFLQLFLPPVDSDSYPASPDLAPSFGGSSALPESPVSLKKIYQSPLQAGGRSRSSSIRSRTGSRRASSNLFVGDGEVLPAYLEMQEHDDEPARWVEPVVEEWPARQSVGPPQSDPEFRKGMVMDGAVSGRTDAGDSRVGGLESARMQQSTRPVSVGDLRTEFDFYDKNGDGVISREEVRAL